MRLAAGAFAATFLREVVAFFAVVFLAVVLRAVVFFAGVVLATGDFLRDVAALRAVVFFAADLRTDVLRVAALRVVVFFAVEALREVDFFAPRAAVEVFLRVAVVDDFFAFTVRLVDFGALVLLRADVLRVEVFAFAEAVRFAVFGTAMR